MPQAPTERQSRSPPPTAHVTNRAGPTPRRDKTEQPILLTSLAKPDLNGLSYQGPLPSSFRRTLVMAITCPRCGREYDVTLFQFGRTIHCACGTRVGLEQRIGPPVSSSEPRFLVDAMLGGLARWLRILGFDAAFDPGIADRELARRSLVEGRHILTRDRALPREWRVSTCTILEEEEVEAQLRAVVRDFQLTDRIRLFSRCARCNTRLEPLSPEEARGRVPHRVGEIYQSFSWCPTCQQVYWEGSHTERMRIRLGKILKP